MKEQFIITYWGLDEIKPLFVAEGSSVEDVKKRLELVAEKMSKECPLYEKGIKAASACMDVLLVDCFNCDLADRLAKFETLEKNLEETKHDSS